MNIKILVVDDDSGLSSGLAEVFALEQMTVTVAQNLSEALLFAETEYDIAIVDGNLCKGVVTGDDGRQVTNKIVTLYPNAKIIGFSGEKYLPDSFWKRHGAFVQKPEGPIALLGIIEQLLG